MLDQNTTTALPRRVLTRSAVATLALGFSLPLWAALQAPVKVQVPTLAFDDQEIILVWEKPADHAAVKDYRVYANGVLLGSSNANNDRVSPAKPYINRFYEQDKANFHHRIGIHSYTAQGLKPDTPYRFTVRSVGADGQESVDSPAVEQRTTPVPAVFDVMQYGARVTAAASIRRPSRAPSTPVPSAAKCCCPRASTKAGRFTSRAT